MAKQSKEKDNFMVRPPIVVVLGHVDHGKTTLLDTIRKTNVAARESGGITQHIGAYQVEHNGKSVTFIDTPGHEAFGKMRSRGAAVADIALIVVAADDGVKPQTEEVLALVEKTNLPHIIVLNKIDMPGAEVDRVKRELADKGVLLEGWGGNVPNVAISAKSGQGIGELLDLILLVAEVSELTCDPSSPARGVVIEAHLDARRGPVATLLVRNGTLKISSHLSIGAVASKIRSLEDFMGNQVVEAGSSMPVLISGLQGVPDVGEQFFAFASEQEARTQAEKEQEKRRFVKRIGSDQAEAVTKLILRADVAGSLEAIEETLSKLASPIVALDILSAETGNIGENDVKLAAASGATIVGFRVKASPAMHQLAFRFGVIIFYFDVIYDLVGAIRKEMEQAIPPEVIRTDLGTLKVLATFQKEGAKQIIGGEVTAGAVTPNTLVDVERAGHPMGKGKLLNVQLNKINVDVVPEGKQCGLQVEVKSVSILPGDALKCFSEEIRKRTLIASK